MFKTVVPMYKEYYVLENAEGVVLSKTLHKQFIKRHRFEYYTKSFNEEK